jgi:hypothetical protein
MSGILFHCKDYVFGCRVVEIFFPCGDMRCYTVNEHRNGVEPNDYIQKG